MWMLIIVMILLFLSLLQPCKLFLSVTRLCILLTMFFGRLGFHLTLRLERLRCCLFSVVLVPLLLAGLVEATQGSRV